MFPQQWYLKVLHSGIPLTEKKNRKCILRKTTNIQKGTYLKRNACKEVTRYLGNFPDETLCRRNWRSLANKSLRNGDTAVYNCLLLVGESTSLNDHLYKYKKTSAQIRKAHQQQSKPDWLFTWFDSHVRSSLTFNNFYFVTIHMTISIETIFLFNH